MAETQVNMSSKELQSFISTVVAEAVKAAKEPTEAEKAKMEKEHQELLRAAKERAELARVQEENKKKRWLGCPHSQVYNGRTFHKWNGQVNSDGMVVPVCNLCGVDAPPFSAAKFLPDGGRQGTNFETWTRCDRELLSELHQKSFNGKCSKGGCLVCDPKKA